MTNRKHHCRNCGNVFDQSCSATSVPLPHYGILESVRVCDGCAKKLKEGRGRDGLGRSNSLGSGGVGRSGLPERSSTISGHRSHSSTSALSGSRNSRSREDDDLQRAIKASLADVAGGIANPSSSSGPDFALRTPDYITGRTGYNTSYPSTNKQSSPAYRTPAAPKPTPGEEEDPDLAAAIAASLRDVAVAPSAPPPLEDDSDRRYGNSANYYAQQPQSRYPGYERSANSYQSNDRQANVYGGGREYENSNPYAVPGQARDRGDAERRKEILEEMEEKLREAGRVYQGLLDADQQQRNGEFRFS